MCGLWSESRKLKLTINEDHKYTVQGGRSLLSTLSAEGVFIPSACGGRGSCGLCKIKAVEGFGQYLPTELPFLDEEERADHIRLSCQIKVKNDLKLEIPEELFSVKEFTAVVERMRDLTHDIKEVYLKLLEPEEIEATQ